MADPILGYGAMQFGSGLFDMLAGDPYEKYRMAGFGAAQNRLGTDVIDIPRAIAQNRATQIPRIRKAGEGINRRFDFDTGRGQNALYRLLMGEESQFNLGAGMQNDRLKSQRDTMLIQALMGAGGGR